MHLLISASQDATSDLIVDSVGEKVLRLNNDRPHDHEIIITSDGFDITDKFGRRVSSDCLTTVILRKMTQPDSNLAGEELYAMREHTRAIEALLDWIERFKPEALPMSHRAMSKATKFVCSSIATGYFTVPDWIYTTKPSTVSLTNPVVKNLAGLPVEEAGPGKTGLMLYVQEVVPSELADGWPWFLQQKIESRYDLTVLFMGGKCCALKLDRNKFSGLDWRRYVGPGVNQEWETVELPPKLVSRIADYMSDVDLRYGRLDFLYTTDDFSDLQFLEVNPHGQWAWMDLNKDRGIFDAMMKFLTTPRTFNK